jgi:hypothetical protein
MKQWAYFIVGLVLDLPLRLHHSNDAQLILKPRASLSAIEMSRFDQEM